MKRYFFLLTLLLCGFLGVAQEMPLMNDPSAEEDLRYGIRFLKNNNYKKALEFLEPLLSRQPSQATSSAVFFSGVAYFYQGNYSLAEDRFKMMANRYPQSRYNGDIQYYRMLMDCEDLSEERQLRGLSRMMEMSEMAVVPGISAQCKTALNVYFYNKTAISILEKLYQQDTAHRALMIEPLLYRLVMKENRKADAKVLMEQYLKQGGTKSESMTRLFHQKKTWEPITRNIVRIAVVIPSFIDSMKIDSVPQGQIPARSLAAVEWYDGFNKALEEFKPSGKNRYYVKVYDSQRDTYTVYKHTKDLDELHPEIVVGDIFNKQSRELAEWTSKNKVPQLIPLSPSIQLTEGKDNVFLMRPSVGTQGAVMAEYAYKDLGLRRCATWTDKKAATNEMVAGFAKTFRALGGEVVEVSIDSIHNRAMGEIAYWWESLKQQAMDGMYMPITNEESAGLILSLMTGGTKIMMAANVQDFNAIDREQKDRLGIYYTLSYRPDVKGTLYQNYREHYKAVHNTFPSENAIRGYDLGCMLMKWLEEYDKSQPLSDFIRKHPPYKGILTYNFNGKQDNQEIGIQQFSRTGVKTLK